MRGRFGECWRGRVGGIGPEKGAPTAEGPAWCSAPAAQSKRPLRRDAVEAGRVGIGVVRLRGGIRK
jgi:hypothetical protein